MPRVRFTNNDNAFPLIDILYVTADLGGPGPQQTGLPSTQTDVRRTLATVFDAFGTADRLVSVLINPTLLKPSLA
jgi:hypothetical protein